jgi:hypothetical protein
MAMTQQGPISMCLHNAKRDVFILAPVRLGGPEGGQFWNPLSGEVTEQVVGLRPPSNPNPKTAKRRRRDAVTSTAPFIAD